MCWHSNKDPQKYVELDNKIYQQLKKSLFPTIKILDVISGGEAFLYSRIDEVLNDSFKYNYLLKIATNGTSITDCQKELLRDLNVQFVISLDGANAELHEKLRVGCSFDKVIQTIKFFVDNGKKVKIRTCVSNHNFYNMQEILNLAEKLNVKEINFQTVQYLDSVKEYNFTKPPEDIPYIKSLKGKPKFSIAFDYFHKSMHYSALTPILNKIISIRKCVYCPNNKNFLKIDLDGIVSSCSMVEAASYGNLNQNSLEDILASCDTIRKSCTCKPMEKYLRR